MTTTTRPVPRVEEAPAFSSNDSHIHIDSALKARREALGVTLKPGETYEVTAPGPQHFCKQCSPNGEVPPPEAPNNRTYDHSVEIAEENEKEEMKRQIAELQELVRSQNRVKTAASPAKAGV